VKSRNLISVIGLVAAHFPGLGMAAELKHFWDFEGEQWWLDKKGTAHGDKPSDTATLEREEGHGGKGESLKVVTKINGGDDQLNLAADQIFQPGEESFSFFFWVRLPDDMTTDPRGIFDFSGNGRDGVQSLYIGTTEELAFRIDFPGSDFSLVKIPVELEDGEWHSVAATYDPTDGLKVHIDGFGVDGSAPAVDASVSMAADCYIGSFNFTGNPRNNGIGGNVDDFAIYSGVLTEEEITALSKPPEKPELQIETVTVAEDGMTITWNGQDGEIYQVWRSSDLETWIEMDDGVIAGSEGGSYLVEPEELILGRMFLQVRQFE
jgi:hypothetical protein